ncbi:MULTISPECIES: DMT family transporter [Shewanella]|uniref:DMT family transporter n=1 Tax=Shewanella fidelis TaxID=173509 RepID=A0AAW8NJM5_9GAMM|nr:MULTISPECIES: DMT family transporter [Shewanella]MDR8522371.1 DMT family transporter [Shewanella fidelis]MDW4812413.1 DMT family transporter [Shewanella fidelis]MDW4816160.1 DMT family transporter [Shewanella fidelis]MDW4820654.1 DMT family transporter [Shewanella fidelis]MDW4824876.1 DMT family transporter [Shewanella fidelis]
MDSKKTGLLELHFAVLLFGGTALFSKLIPLSALDITLLRCVVAATVLALIVKLSKQSIRLNAANDYLIAIGLGIIVSLHWVTYFASMQLSSVAIGMIAFFTYPVMTVLVEPMVTNTKLKFADIISGITVLIGVYLLIPEASLGNDVTLGILIGILSAALFTARNLLHKRYFSAYSGQQAMLYQTAVAVIFLAPWLSVDPSTIEQNVWWLIVLLGVVFTAAPHALFTSALRLLSAKTVGLVSCLQPFYGAVLALILLGEDLAINTVIGGTLVVATALFETQQSHRSNSLKKTA